MNDCKFNTHQKFTVINSTLINTKFNCLMQKCNKTSSSLLWMGNHAFTHYSTVLLTTMHALLAWSLYISVYLCHAAVPITNKCYSAMMKLRTAKYPSPRSCTTSLD